MNMQAFNDTIERIKDFCDRFTFQYVIPEEFTEEGLDGHLVAITDPESYIAEQYKALCSKFISTTQNEAARSILVTSAQPGEGKTTTVCNLAATLALTFHKKVLVIDTDLRRPAIHSYCNIPKEPGLREVLEGKVPLGYFTLKALVSGLYVIPSGAGGGSPSEMLNSDRMKRLLSSVYEQFDHVILDAPPVLKAADAHAIGAMSDYVLFVVEAGATPRAMIEEAFSLLENTGAMPKGCVLNSAERAPDYYSLWTNSRYREYYLNKYDYYQEE